MHETDLVQSTVAVRVVLLLDTFEHAQLVRDLEGEVRRQLLGDVTALCDRLTLAEHICTTIDNHAE